MNARTLLLLLLVAAPPIAAAESGPVAATANGSVQGFAEEGVERFLGVPFAAPPVGDRRWRPPVAAQSWTGVRPATTYGADCAQKPFYGDDAPLATTPSEDCLYLNVWRPAGVAPGAKLPVMVWIHGGAFVNGGTSPAIYDGARMALDGVVVVSANHRLGRFGFFAHPALTAEAAGGPNANYGFMDQIAALRWVADNIAGFGGDPANVTIFGESAGGEAVNILLSTPLARGLFHKAIVMSGGGRDTLLPPATLPKAEAAGQRFAAHNGVADTGATGLASLRALSTQTLIGGMNLINLANFDDYAGPVVDGVVVEGLPLARFRAGALAPVPVMVGATSADGWSTGGTKETILSAFAPRQAEAASLFDPTGQDTAEIVGHRVNGDAIFIEPARASARAIAATGQPVYLYRFSYVAEKMRAKWAGTPHAKELPFIFDRVMARYGSLTTQADMAMAGRLRHYWTSFARTGVPAPAGEPAAPRFDPANEWLIDFANQGPLVISDPLKARLDLTEWRLERR